MNHYAKAVKPQQVIPDKREKTLRQIWNETAQEEVPEHLTRLLNDLD